MNINDFKNFMRGKSVAVIGIGVSNTPVINMLLSFGARVTARDKCKEEELEIPVSELREKGVSFILGDDYLKNITEEIIFKTPGIRPDKPELVSAKEKGTFLTSEMEMFFELCPAEITAVTGSDGKTTTTTLIYEMLKAEGYKCHLGGNIGKPLLSEIENISACDKVVLELSSFQLQTMSKSPDIAVVTNVSPNHLDYHTDMDEYIEAKKNIFSHQNADSLLVVNHNNEITKSFAKHAKGRVTYFGRSNTEGIYVRDGVIYAYGTPVVKTSDILLPGEHNVENYMAAIGAVWGKVGAETIKKISKTFGGVEHRIEFVREKDGVRYYNDSIASSPTRARACLYSFDKKIIVIAGGYDKKIPFDDFGKDLVKRAKAVLLLGETAKDIRKAIENAQGEKPPIVMAKDLEDAVFKAKDIAKAGDVVVLSPACASFDMFKNFEQRGNMFKQIVAGL